MDIGDVRRAGWRERSGKKGENVAATRYKNGAASD
jgi:hypothetical protein